MKTAKETWIQGQCQEVEACIWHYSRYGLNPITLILPVNQALHHKMKLFPLVSLLTIRIFIFLQFIVGSNFYLRQRYRHSVVYLYTYFTYIDILFH